MTLKSDVKYILDGWVYIKDGATLTIEPGTVIKGKTGTKASLIIERGGKIMAEGTAQKPKLKAVSAPNMAEPILMTTQAF